MQFPIDISAQKCNSLEQLLPKIWLELTHLISFITEKISANGVLMKLTCRINIARDSTILATNTEISPNFLVWKFCGNAQLPQSFGGIARNAGEATHFHKISTQGNWVKFWYFTAAEV